MLRTNFSVHFLLFIMLFSSFIVIKSISTTTSNSSSSPNFKTNSFQTRSDQWILSLQANYQNASWFYQNLNTTDRLKIREAMDYAIPRDYFINEILDGFGTPLATYELPQSGIFYNTNVSIKPFNLTIASQLLTQVFGYKYSTTDNSNTPYIESFDYFPLNLIIPNSATRASWNTPIIQSFNSIGIGTNSIVVSFANFYERAFPTSSDNVGWDYIHGGFDGIIIGWGTSIFPNDGSFFFQSKNIPNFNYQVINSSIIDDMITKENNPYLTADQRIAYYWEMQQYVSDQSLRYILALNTNPYIFSKGLQGFNKFFANQGTLPYQNVTIPGQNNMTIAIPYVFGDLIPNIIDNSYSNYFSSSLWLGGLLRFSTITDKSDESYYTAYSNIVYANYTISGPDGTNNTLPFGMFYNFTIKPGIKWADGNDLTANDVAFTYHQEMNPSRNTNNYGSLSYYMDNDSILVYDKYHIGFNLTNWADPFPFGENLFTINILPASTYGQISNWANSTQNTGFNLTAALYNSNGPYQLSSFNESTGETILSVNPLFNSSSYIFPDDSGSTNETYAEYVSHVPGFNVTPTLQSVTIKPEFSSIIALSDLKAGVINYVDPSVGLISIYPDILHAIKADQIDEVNVTTGIFQELGLNQASPIWGYSPTKLNYYFQPTTLPPDTTISTRSTSSNIPTTLKLNNDQIVTDLVIGLTLIGGISISVLSFIAIIQYSSYRRKNYSKSNEKPSFRDFLMNLKKKRKMNNPQAKIDDSLETLEKIIAENKEN